MGPRYNFVPGPANSLGSHGRTEAGGKHEFAELLPTCFLFKIFADPVFG